MLKGINVIKLSKKDKLFLLLATIAVGLVSFFVMSRLWHQSGKQLQPVVEEAKVTASVLQKDVSSTLKTIDGAANQVKQLTHHLQAALQSIMSKIKDHGASILALVVVVVVVVVALVVVVSYIASSK